VKEQYRRAASNRKSSRSPERRRYRQHGRGYRRKLDYQVQGWITAT